MTIAGIAAALCLFGFWTTGFYGMYLHLKIVEAINRARPNEKRIEFMSFSWNRWGRLMEHFRLYRRHYPSGRLTAHYWIANAAAMMCFVAFALCFLQAAR
jgi:hypothetical protein